MNLPCLEEFGCFSSALQSSRNLESIVIDLSGCGQVSIDARMELHQSIKSLKWLRGGLDTWVNIEGCQSENGSLHLLMLILAVLSKGVAPGASVSSGNACDNSVPASCHMSAQCTLNQPGLAGPAPQAVTNQLEKMRRQRLTALNRRCLMKANRSHAAILHVILFILLRAVIAKGTAGRAFSRGFCVAGNAWRQNLELSVLILAQAVAEVESRFLLVLLVLSLLPVASYAFSQSTGVSGTLIFLIVISTAIVSIFYTTARLNRMHTLSRRLEVESEALYAKNLQNDMSRLFGDSGRADLAQPQVTSLTEHFVEARKRLDDFDKNLCLPLREFLEEQPGSISRQDLPPVLMTLPMAQEAVVREGGPSQNLGSLVLRCTLW